MATLVKIPRYTLLSKKSAINDTGESSREETRNTCNQQRHIDKRIFFIFHSPVAP